jgi:hypothetical protein
MMSAIMALTLVVGKILFSWEIFDVKISLLISIGNPEKKHLHQA